MLKANFSPENKLTSLEFTFDVMSFMQQLPRATGDDYEVVRVLGRQLRDCAERVANTTFCTTTPSSLAGAQLSFHGLAAQP